MNIQLGHPKINTIDFEEFGCVKDAFRKLFHTHEESLYVFWNEVPIRLHYREDLYRNFDNILAMAWLLKKQCKGKTVVTLKNQILEAQLELHWYDDLIQVEGSFSELLHVYKPFCDCLNKTPKLKTSKHAFLKEWHTLLHQIVLSLDAGSIEVEDGTERRKLEMLRELNQSIKGFGVLYERVIT